jgi:hypothetical protein
MPEYRHPRAGDGPGQPPARVHVSRAENAPVTDGTFTAPEGVARAIADAHGVDVSEMRVGGDSDATSGTCDAIKSDGEVCGRELPCPYHSEGGDE